MKLTLAIWLACAVPAMAQNCAPSEEVNTILAGDWGERIIGGGFDPETGFLLEIWVSPGGATWTAVTRDADGMSCVEASGEDWKVSRINPGGTDG